MRDNKGLRDGYINKWFGDSGASQVPFRWLACNLEMLNVNGVVNFSLSSEHTLDTKEREKI